MYVWNAEELELKEFCREHCDYGRTKCSINNCRQHWRTARHLSNKSLLFDEFQDSRAASTLSVAQEESICTFMEDDYADNEIINLCDLSDQNFFLGDTCRDFSLWLRQYRVNMSRNGLRHLQRLITRPNFIARQIPTEYTIKSLDLRISGKYYKLRTVLHGDSKSISILPISELVFGILQSSEFQKALLSSNTLPAASDSDQQYEIMTASKMRDLLNLKDPGVLYIQYTLKKYATGAFFY
jgi:hypothetical protein